MKTGMPETHQPSEPVCIVGIGASAGGLEAIEEFFDHMPPDSGLAFVVVQHLSPDFKSMMDELIGRRSDMPARFIHNEQRIEPNSIYLIPPKHGLSIADGTLLLSDQEPSAFNLPIDAFFGSLAQEYGCRSVGIILSGTGSDGTRGVQEIHDADGMVIVQSTESAKFDGMPQSAIATGVADYELPPHSMPEILLQRQSHLGRRQGPVVSRSVEFESSYMRMVAMIRDRFGIDLTLYKPGTIERRIERRLAIGRFETFDEYAAELLRDDDELDRLYADMLIGTTQFFRDDTAFEKLRRDVIPELIASASDTGKLRLWVPGCATGEEAYSLAMMLDQAMMESGEEREIKIFASDVHQASIESAAAGIFSQEQVSEVSPEQLQRYFVPSGESFQISPLLRRMVIFATHNIFKDPPFTNLDMVACRNMLIYFQGFAQRKALATLHFSLRTGGVLFLGPSESLGELDDEFDVIDSRNRIFRKRREVRLANPFSLSPPPVPGRVPRELRSELNRSDEVLQRVYASMLDEIAPPGFLVNEHLEVLHVFGDAKKYLSVPSGRVSTDLSKLIVKDLQLPVKSSIFRTKKGESPVVFNQVAARVGDESYHFDLCARSISDHRSEANFFLVSIEKCESTQQSRIDEAKSLQHDQDDVSTTGLMIRCSELERELNQTREHLQSTIEELESSNEELQSTNEELVASNDELQATNEELHSVNEELHSVNTEHQHKISELMETTADLDNLIRASEIGTVFVDEDCRIRKFTPAIQGLIHLRSQDIGRPIDHMGHNLDLGDKILVECVDQVRQSDRRQEYQVRTKSGSPLLMRIVPYRLHHGKEAGVVICFVDLTNVEEVREHLNESQRRLNATLSAANIGLWEWQVGEDVVTWDDNIYRIFGAPKDGVHRRYEDVLASVHPDDIETFERDVDRAIKEGEPYDTFYRIIRGDGVVRWLHAKGVVLRDDLGRATRMMGICWDDTARLETLGERERLASIIEMTNDAVITVSQSGKIESWNSGAEMLYGYPPEEILGQPIERLRADKGWERFEKMIRDAISGNAVSRTRICHSQSDGSTIHLSASACPVFHTGGRISGAAAILRDVTELVEAESSTAAVNARLKRVNAELEQFSFIASHDLREPLRTTRSFCELIHKKYQNKIDEQADRWLHFIIDATSRMQELIDALMSYSRLDLHDPPSEQVDLNCVIADVLSDLQTQIGESGAVIDAGTLPQLRVDRVLMAQLFQNLISNAIKFSGTTESREGKPPTISISAQQRNGCWEISVSDNGIGIEDEFRQKVFDLFRRLHDRETYPGTGIGLAVCQKIVRLHSGRIWAESNEPHGTVIRFSIPDLKSQSDA